jgi:hypothetical protein
MLNKSMAIMYIDYPSLKFEEAGDRSIEMKKSTMECRPASIDWLVEQQDVGIALKATEQRFKVNGILSSLLYLPHLLLNCCRHTTYVL